MGAPGLHPGGPVSASESEWERRESVAIDWNRPPAEVSEPYIWARSSAGRAPGLHPGGRRFEPGRVHQRRCTWAYSSVWLERTPDKREVGGSNPPRPTISTRLIMLI